MTVYITVLINQDEFFEIKNLTINKNLSEYNSASSFSFDVDNDNGKFSNKFSLNDEIMIYAEKDVNPPTKKIFGGVIEDIQYTGRPNRETIKVSGRDYTALLQDVVADAVAYRDTEASQIVIDLIAQNIGNITTNNVNVTPYTIERITFNQINLFDSIKKVAEISGFYFYVDADKDLHFKEKSAVASGYKFDENNTTYAHFTINDRDIYNSVRVFGGRILTGTNEVFTADGGSVFTLSSKPHNVTVFKNDLIQSYGGVEGIDDPANTNNLNWIVDYDRSQVIFVSGTAAGDNIPTSGTDIISIDYNRNTPLIKYKQDTNSIAQYGLKTKVIVDKNIQSFAEANDVATTFLNENKDPIIQGTVKVKDIIDITPGTTVQVNFPNHNINYETYAILKVAYKFDKITNLTGQNITVTLNKKVSDLTDTIKEILLKQQQLSTSDLDKNLTTLRTSTGDFTMESHYELWTKSGTHFPFTFQRTGQNNFNSPHAVLGPWELGSTLLTSGGDF